MATDRRTREARKEAGWRELSVQVPPALAKLMEQQRGSTPRSQWLIQQALSILPPGLTDGISLTWGRPGRKRMHPLRTPTIPDIAIPLRTLTYRRIVLASYLEWEVGDSRDSITLRKTNDDQIVITWKYLAQFGGVEVYDMARRCGGRYGYYDLQDGSQSVKGMLMPTMRKAEQVMNWVTGNGGKVRNELVQRSITPLVRIRPLIRQTSDEPLAWSLEIDLSPARESDDLAAMHCFLTTSWRWSPPLVSWFKVDEVPDLIVSSGLSSDMLAEMRRKLPSYGAEVQDDQPWGIADDAVRVTRDPLGMLYGVEANRQDRRCIMLPTECSTSQWGDFRELLDDIGVVVHEQQPTAHDPNIDWDRVPGWNRPVASGKMLYDYQREGIEFAMSRNFRCMIGDEMKVGKTAQAIGAVNVRGCKRVVAILPRSVVHIWRKNIREWSNPGAEPRIIEVKSSTTPPSLPVISDDDRITWVLTTFDMLTPRTERIRLNYNTEQQAEITEAFKAAGAGDALRRDTKGVLMIVIDPEQDDLLRAVEQVVLPDWVSKADTDKVKDALTKAAGTVLQALVKWNPDGTVVDEAHRIKNPKAGRTRAARKLLQDLNRLAILLSGTLIRNDINREGVPMLEAVISLDQHYRDALRAGVNKQELITKLFRHYMIRRPLSVAQPNLPPILRERVDIPPGEKAAPLIQEYNDLMILADQKVYEVLKEGGTMAQAKDAGYGMWSKARRVLTEAKIADGYIADVIFETVEESVGECALVFGHHVEAMDMLAEQVTAKGLTVVKAYGSYTSKEEAERQFQEREVDVYIGGLTTAEGTTLDRADSCLFIEQDWVPGNLLQAEARARGRDQKAPNGYMVRTCMNSFGLADDIDLIMAGVLSKKMPGLNELYDEDISLSATIITSADDVRDALAARSAERARERMRREGISPGVKKKGKPKGGSEPDPEPT